MFLISHRGNIAGENRDLENSPEQIKKVLRLGFDVEIDVWMQNNQLYLGHDFPVYEIEEEFLVNEKLWCHAKNSEALMLMRKNKKIHCFWHQNDDFTITSNGYVWAYPGKQISDRNCIVVLPELGSRTEDFSSFGGICSDNIIDYTKY